MKTNYHTHTKRCRHASGTDEEYVLAAIEGGFSTLGFSDHMPWFYTDDYISDMRMGRGQVDDYFLSVECLRDKYAEKIEIKSGLECEYYPDSMDWLKFLKAVYEPDYLILGNHFLKNEQKGLYAGHAFTEKELKLYLDTSIAAMQTKLYTCFAHPELFVYACIAPSRYAISIFRELAIAARDLGVVFERNVQTPFHIELWEEVADVQPKVIIGIDAHKPKALLTDAYEDNLLVMRSLGIEPILTL
ncbi:MAG: histidinol-phosphatase [Rikenellaceae bacterium]